MTLRFIRLSRDAVRKLKPGQRINEHGIVAERLASGDVRWSIGVMIGGRRVHRVVGTESSGTTRFQAEQLIEKVKTDARADRLDLSKGRKAPLTFAKAAADYINRLEQTGGKNIYVKKLHFRSHLIPAFGTKRLSEIAQIDVERYKRNRRNAGAAAATCNRELSTLGHLFTMALEWAWIDRLPVRVKKLQEENSRIITLSDTEIDRLLKAAIAGSDPDVWLFIEVARATGMRHREILRIQWKDCDLTNRRIFLPRAKAGARTQPITQTLADVLHREKAMRSDQEGWIFPARHGDSTKGHLDNLGRQFRAAVIAAGLDPKAVTPHTLRHSVVTKLVQSGADLMTVMAISGHKSLKMVQRYSHISAPHIDEAIKALDRTG
jgi:integrase